MTVTGKLFAAHRPLYWSTEQHDTNCSVC